MSDDQVIQEVRAAAQALVDAFGHHRTDDYFACFHPDATFVFYLVPERLESRAAFREDWERSVRETGFRVLECTTSDQRIQLFGDVAVLTHTVYTRQRAEEIEEDLVERETIVFQRQADGRWLAVHEHLSPLPEDSDEVSET
jgi:ketosteroid isomerase-like protein